MTLLLTTFDCKPKILLAIKYKKNKISLVNSEQVCSNVQGMTVKNYFLISCWLFFRQKYFYCTEFVWVEHMK